MATQFYGGGMSGMTGMPPGPMSQMQSQQGPMGQQQGSMGLLGSHPSQQNPMAMLGAQMAMMAGQNPLGMMGGLGAGQTGSMAPTPYVEAASQFRNNVKASGMGGNDKTDNGGHGGADAANNMAMMNSMMAAGGGGMMMPWGPMMGQMDPNMMMWGGWGQMAGGMSGNEALPQAQRQVITLKNAVLTPPAPDAPMQSTRERPPGCRTIFVGGVPDTMTEELLREMFLNCGSMCSVRLSKKNFAHIRFDLHEAVDRAMYFSGYRIKIDDKDDKANTGRIHVDFAQARDDQYEWECQQRALESQQKAMEREVKMRQRQEDDQRRPARPTSPPPIIHYSDHEALILVDNLKESDKFMKGSQMLMTWLERGDCNRRTAPTFYSLLQSTNGHVRRLMTDKSTHVEELEQMKLQFQIRLEGILNQFEQIDKVFTAAFKQKSWDHFTKAQRKTLETWRKQLQEVKAAQEAEFFQNRGDGDAGASDSEDDGEAPGKKRRIVKQEPVEKTPASMMSMAAEWIGASQLRNENESLKQELEQYKNEASTLKQEAKAGSSAKDKQMKALQMALQGMQQQLIGSKAESKKVENQLRQMKLANERLKADMKSEDVMEKSESDEQQKETIGKDDDEAGVSAVASLPSQALSSRDARFVALVAAFLHVHPFGANIDYVWSYLNRLDVKIRTSELQELLETYPSIFQQDSTGAATEKKWKFVGFEVDGVSL